MPTLDWIGKKAVENHHNEIPFRLLKCDKNLSVGNPKEGNLIVQGDNLHALKALLPYYAGKVKCIYIDPPYNTGNEKWIYNDNVNSPEIRRWLNEVVGREGEDLSRHDKWLCMMYPRLQLLRRLLSVDGAIFISIDDEEQAHLKILMDEIFGGNNFVANIIWQKKHTVQNDSKYLSDNHDFIVLYARNKSVLNIRKLPRTKESIERYKNHDNDPRGPWTSLPLQVKTPSEKYIYEIVTPSGRKVNPPEGRSWAFGRERFMELLKANRIYFGPKGNNVPRYKSFLSEVSDGIVARTIWLRERVGDNQKANTEISEILGKGKFQSPKPTKLIEQIIRLVTDKEDLILDSFAGSGTTAHAVLDLNKEDDGNRKFILVELEENICKEVTAERVKRVINGYEVEKLNGTIEIVEGLGGGFRYCKLTEPLFDELGSVNKEVKFEDLARHIFFSETGQPLPEKIIKSPLIGIYDNTAYYLLYNGIMGDKTINGGNMLTGKILKELPEHNGQKIIFGEGTRLSLSRLRKEGIIFKQIPYEVKVT